VRRLQRDPREKAAAALAALKAERDGVASQGRKIEAEAAPIVYVAELLGAGSDSERAIVLRHHHSEGRRLTIGYRWSASGTLSDLARRKPKMLNPALNLVRTAARRTPGGLFQEPPRLTRPSLHDPVVQADPSAGAPL